jgi:hypothetical protein
MGATTLAPLTAPMAAEEGTLLLPELASGTKAVVTSTPVAYTSAGYAVLKATGTNEIVDVPLNKARGSVQKFCDSMQ